MLGLVLIKRNTRSMILTDSGNILFNKFKNHDVYLSEIIDELTLDRNAFQGQLKICLPISFAHSFINSKLTDFCNKYPNIELLISYQNKVNLSSDDFDVIVTGFLPNNPNQKIRRIYSSKLVLCCSDKYYKNHQLPQKLDQIRSHKLINVENDLVHTGNIYTNNNRLFKLNDFKVNVTVNSSLQALEIVKNGDFIGVILDYFIEQSGLIRIFPQYHFGVVNYYLIKTNITKNKKIDAFVKFIESSLDKAIKESAELFG